jgi:hypothetical protein
VAIHVGNGDEAAAVAQSEKDEAILSDRVLRVVDGHRELA